MEKDITGRAAEKSAKIIANVLENVKSKVPLGPGQVKMTREELRREMSNMRGEPMRQLIDILGDEEVLNIMRGR